MTIKNSRAQRRHDRARLKKKRRNHWGYGHQGWRGHEVMSKATAGMVVETPTPCSCYMCGNPRRAHWANVWEILTIQEHKAYLSALDGFEEVEDMATYRWEKYDDFYDDWDIWDYGDDPADDWYLRWLYIK